MRIDQKVLVKDFVTDAHWVTWKVPRENFAVRVRESNLFFSFAKDCDRKAAPQLGGRKFGERYTMFLRKIGWQKGFANRRAKVSRKIIFSSWRMAILSRKKFDQSSYSTMTCFYRQIRNSWSSMQTTRKDTQSVIAFLSQLIWFWIDHLLHRAIRQLLQQAFGVKEGRQLSCLLRKAILPRPRRSRCRQTRHVQIFIKSNLCAWCSPRKPSTSVLFMPFPIFIFVSPPKK